MICRFKDCINKILNDIEIKVTSTFPDLTIGVLQGSIRPIKLYGKCIYELTNI